MVKSLFADYDSTAGNNTDIGGVNIDEGCAAPNVNNALREQMSHIADHFAQGSVADSATPDLGAESEHYIVVAGTTTITGFGTVKAGTLKFVEFSGARTITHNATSLIMPGATNVVTAAGDVGIFVSEGSGNWRCLSYQRAVTPPPVPASRFHAVAGAQSMASATNVKVQFSVESFDVGSYYDAATNYRVTPGNGETWLLSASIAWDVTNGVDGERLITEIYKNNSLLYYTEAGRTGSGGYVALPISTMVVGNGTDYYEIFGLKSGAGAGQTVNSQSWFMGMRIA